MLSQASEYVKPLVPTFIGNCKLFEQLEDRKLAKINRKFSLSGSTQARYTARDDQGLKAIDPTPRRPAFIEGHYFCNSPSGT